MIKEAHNLDNILKEHAVDLADKMHQYINLHEYDNFRTERTQEEIDALFTKIKEDLLKGDTDAYIKYMYKASNSKIGGKSEPIGFLDRIYELNVLHEQINTKESRDKYEAVQTTRLALDTGNKYFTIHESEDGYDYSIYDKQYNLLDGGVYDDNERNFYEVVNEIMIDEWGISISSIKEIEVLNYDAFTDLVEELETIKLEEKTAKFEGRNGEVTQLLDIIMHPGELKENNFYVPTFGTERGNNMELGNTTLNTKDIDEQEQIKREMAQVEREENMYQYQDMLEENLDIDYQGYSGEPSREAYEAWMEEELRETYEEWKKEAYGTTGLSFEDMMVAKLLPEDLDKEDLLDKYFSGDYESIKEVTVGYDNSEDKYKGYKEQYSPTMAEYIEFDNLPGQHIIATNNQYEGTQFTFHYSKEFAEEVLNNLEGEGEISIEDEIKQFEEKLREAGIDTYGIKVSVQPEINNGGNFYSYQVENFNSLLLDNCFSLNEEKVKECTLMIGALGKEIEGFHIESIEKGSKPYGFHKYYEVTFKKGEFEMVDEVIISPLVFAQGQERKTLDVILDGVDFDWLNEEYTTWRNEQPDYEDRLSELKEATSKLEECNQKDMDMLAELDMPLDKHKTR